MDDEPVGAGRASMGYEGVDEVDELDEFDEVAELESGDEASYADELIDDLLPEQFDWRRVVRRYPIPALLLAAVGGFLLGRSRGEEIVEALGDAAGDHVSSRLTALADDELI